jgi:hypothetical protein
MTQDQVVAIAVALLAGSEVLSMLPGIRANGWIQLAVTVLRAVASQKRR